MSALVQRLRNQVPYVESWHDGEAGEDIPFGEDLLEAADEIDRLRLALHNIARNSYGLQGIIEDYGHDPNKYNFHAMNYWHSESKTFQKIAREALK